MSADDLHVAEFVTWWNDKNDWTKRPPPKKPLVTFDGNRCYDVMAGGFTARGHRVALLQPARPAAPAANQRGLSAVMKHLLEGSRKGRRLGRSDRAVLVGPADAGRPGAGRFDRGGHQPLLPPRSLVMNEADGKPRNRKLYPNPFGNARWSQYIYFNSWNAACGFRPAPAAARACRRIRLATIAFMYTSTANSATSVVEASCAGQVFVTNGPLLRPTVEGEPPGHVFHAEAGKELELEIALTLSTARPDQLFRTSCKTARCSIRSASTISRKTGRLPKLHFKESGWFLIRAVTDLPDTYRFAMTAPYYVEFGDRRRISKRAAQFFLDWVDERARRIELTDPRAAPRGFGVSSQGPRLLAGFGREGECGVSLTGPRAKHGGNAGFTATKRSDRISFMDTR